MNKLKELRQQYAKLVTDSRDFYERIKSENRAMSADELEQDTRREADIQKLEKEIQNIEQQEERAAQAAERAKKLSIDPTRVDPGAGGAGDASANQEMRGFQSWLLRSAGATRSELQQRDLTSTLGPEGGAIVAPVQFVSTLLIAVTNQLFIRGLSTIYSVPNAETLGIPSLDADPDDADWTSELATGAEDNAMTFGGRELRPQPLAKRILVSKHLMRKAMMNPEQIVIQRMAYKFGVAEEKAMLTGDGVKKPLGVFTPSDQGIPTSRDITAGNTTTALKPDNLINVQHALREQYQANAVWIMHRDHMSSIRKEKDTQGRYLLNLNTFNEGRPATLLDKRYYLSEYAPNTMTTGQYAAIYGDFRQGHVIADSLQLEMEVLRELYAEKNRVGFIARREVDAMPVLAEAFVRSRLA